MTSHLADEISHALRRYWGKADTQFGDDAWHPLDFHSLDVAAVARRYLQDRPRLLACFAKWLNMSDARALALLCAIIALHDLGKAAENFQSKRADLFAQRFAERQHFPQRHTSHHHDSVGARFVENALAQLLGEDFVFSDNLAKLLGAACGHHGKPASGDAFSLSDAMSLTAQANAAAWCRHVFALFALKDEDFQQLAQANPQAVKMASWWLAGLTVLADWVGSNTAWFGYASADQRHWPCQRYWDEIAMPTASCALQQAQLTPQPVAAWQSMAALFPSLADATPTPAQQACSTLQLGDASQLVLLEDATGAGKTEAALILAQRLMSAGLASGLYFGLPTQATSDQMYARMDAVGARLFADHANPAIVLAHSAREQNLHFRQRKANAPESSDGTDTASQQALNWLTQGNKRSLLAHVGVGTIDQVQLTGLRVKHQPLRLLGLFDKVLIIDEVHAYDRYMQAVLCNVLQAHAAAGGSAVLLSATLPLADRQRLFQAFAQGHNVLTAQRPMSRLQQLRAGRAGQAPSTPALTPPTSLAYPLLTHYCSGARQCLELPVKARPQSQRRVLIDYRDKQDDVDALVIQAQQQGRAVCWIRNSVAEAIETWQRLSARLPPGSVTLFHSRFALADRLRIQNEVLRRFDRHSDASLRAGQIVVATQVLEQSLDVDFDVMVSDLAPVDVLLQRQGRLHRHLRDAHGNPLASGSDGRGQPVLVVFGPPRDSAPDKDWLRRHSHASAKIYPAHGQLWLSAQAIGDALHLTNDFRDLVQAVYDEQAQYPGCFDDAAGKASGKAYSQTNIANQNSTHWEQGYTQGNDWNDDEHIGTRLGQSIEAVLLTYRDGVLQPLAPACPEAADPLQRLARSSIRLPEHWPIHSDAQSSQIHPRQSQDMRQLCERLPGMKYRVLVVLDDGIAQLRNADGRVITLHYVSTMGLQMQRAK